MRYLTEADLGHGTTLFYMLRKHKGNMATFREQFFDRVFLPKIVAPAREMVDLMRANPAHAATQAQRDALFMFYNMTAEGNKHTPCPGCSGGAVLEKLLAYAGRELPRFEALAETAHPAHLFPLTPPRGYTGRFWPPRDEDEDEGALLDAETYDAQESPKKKTGRKPKK